MGYENEECNFIYIYIKIIFRIEDRQTIQTERRGGNWKEKEGRNVDKQTCRTLCKEEVGKKEREREIRETE